MVQKTISAAEAGRDLTRFLREVSAGEDQYIVEADGVPLVLVVPLDTTEQIISDRRALVDQLDQSAARAKLTEEEADILAQEAVDWARQHGEVSFGAS
jgi:prevent-host-death family protein